MTEAHPDSEHDYDFDVDDSFIRQVDEAELRVSGRRDVYEIEDEDEDEDEDDEFEMDDSFMRHVEDAEARAGKRSRVIRDDDNEKENRVEVIEISD